MQRGAVGLWEPQDVELRLSRGILWDSGPGSFDLLPFSALLPFPFGLPALSMIAEAWVM